MMTLKGAVKTFSKALAASGRSRVPGRSHDPDASFFVTVSVER